MAPHRPGFTRHTSNRYHFELGFHLTPAKRCRLMGDAWSGIHSDCSAGTVLVSLQSGNFCFLPY